MYLTCPLISIIIIVVIKLLAPIIDEAPAKCKLKIPKSVKKIALNAFCGCKLDDIILPKHLAHLKEKLINYDKNNSDNDLNELFD